MKKEQKQILITILGCLLAIVMVCAQLSIYCDQIPSAKKEINQSEQESSTSGEAEMIVMASFSLPSPIHVQLNLDPHLLFEILFEDEGEKQIPSVESSSLSEKLLVTLFRVIISPNAP